MRIFNLFVLSLLFSVFAYSQAPTISAFPVGSATVAPYSGASGTTMTINGTNLTGATAVSFGGTPASSFTVVSSVKITAVVAGGSTGSVSVTTPGGTVTRAGFTYLPLSRLITDFGGYWSTTTAAASSTVPDNSHNLLGFNYNSTFYSTGVSDATLTSNSVSFTPGNWRALPVAGIAGSNPGSSSVYLAIASKADGSAATGNVAGVSSYSIKSVFLDGTRGLDLGTGVTNLPASAIMNFNIHSIDPLKISDAEPDILITQIADPSVGNDNFQFINASGVLVGNAVTQDMTLLTSFGTYSLDLFSLPAGAMYNTATPTGVSSSNVVRNIRVAAFKLSDFGITSGNVASVKALKITPSGNSDYAFIGYNANSINIPPNISQNDATTVSTVCSNGTAVLAVIGTAASGGTLSYAWEQSTDGGSVWTSVSNGGNFSGATTSLLSIANPVNAYKYRATVSESTTGNPTNTSSVFTLVVSSPSVGGTSSGSVTVCSGTNSSTLTLSGHTGAILRWEYSLNSFGSSTTIANTTTSLTATNLTATTQYRAVIQNGVCATDRSVPATITVNPVSAGGTISGGTSVCSGNNSSTLTLSGQTGNILRWESSTNNFSTSTTIANTTTSLTANNLSATTDYRAVVQSGVCASANSVAGTVIVDAPSVGGSLSGSATVCSGTNSTTFTLSGHTGSVVKWQSSTDNFSSVITDISNTTTSLTATNLTASTQYRAVVQSGVCVAASSVTGAVTVNAPSVGGTLSGGTTVCSGTNSTTLTLSSHTGSVVKWQSSTDNFSSVITDISNTTTSLTAANLTASTQYRAVVQSGACVAANSAAASIIVNPASAGGSISGSTSVCSGANSATLTLSGYTGSILRWESSVNNFSSSTTIANTTTTLTAANLTATTKYRAVIQSGVCVSANSAIATITVNAPSAGGSVSGGATVCSGTNSTTLTLSGHTGTIVKWQSSTDNFSSAISDISNTTTSLTAVNLSATTKYRAVIQSGSCSSSYSSSATVTVQTGQWIGGSSGDWNNPANWCGGVPTSSTDISIPASSTVHIQTDNGIVNSVTIAPGASVVMTGSFNLRIAPGGTFTNNGTFDATGSTGAVSFLGDGTVTGNTTFKNIETAGALDFGTSGTVAGEFTIQPGGSVTGNSPTYLCPGSTLTYNTGGVHPRSLEWPSVSSGKGLPSNVKVKNNTSINFPVLGAGYVCNDLTIENGSALHQNYSGASAPLTVGRNVTINGTLSLGNSPGDDITLAGDWTRNSGGVFNNNGLTVTFNGTGNSTITAPTSSSRDANGAYGGETFYNVNVNKTSAANTVSLGSNVSVLNELKVTKGIFDLMNNNVTVVSNSSATAHIASVPASGAVVRYGGAGSTGTGKFIIQRHLDIGTGSASRRWRLLTAPIQSSGAPNINAAWQEGVSNSDKSSPVDPSPGFGTTITKSMTYSAANGYDQGSTENPSMYYLSPAGVWTALASTKSGAITDKEGYMLFARGNRSIVVSTPAINASPTILEPKGKINVGNVSKSLIAGYQTIGNPYASAVNFGSASFSGYTSGGSTYNTTAAASAGVGITYYIFDPKTSGTSGVGKFISCSSNGNGTFAVTGNSSGLPSNGTIQSGTAFMISADNAGGTLTFHETDKVTSSSTAGVSSRGTIAGTIASLTTNLFAGAAQTASLADGVINAFHKDYLNAVSSQDAVKMNIFNSKEGLGITREGKSLAIERRNTITDKDTIFLSITNMSKITYGFQFIPQNLGPLLTAFLEDKFTGASKAVSTTDTSFIPFDVTADVNSSASNRFRIVLKKAQEPVTIKSVQAIRQDSKALVQWSIDNETGITEFKVEKSIDGKTFTKVNAALAKGRSASSNGYSWLDENVVNGENFYRVVSISASGKPEYSKVVKVSFDTENSTITVQPNPVTGRNIGLQFSNLPAGEYNVKIMNANGQNVSETTIQHKGGNRLQNIIPSVTLAVGNYQMIVAGENKTYTTKVMVTK